MPAFLKHSNPLKSWRYFSFSGLVEQNILCWAYFDLLCKVGHGNTSNKLGIIFPCIVSLSKVMFLVSLTFCSFLKFVLLALGWILASEQKEGAKNFPYPSQGESREMTKAIIPPFHHIFCFCPAFFLHWKD